MRVKRVAQASIYEIFAVHELAQELKGISAWLDGHAQILDWVEADLCRGGIKDTGRLGMSVESVLRCALLKQYWQWTYRELEYHLMDSDTAYGFARLGKYRGFSDSTLQQTINQIRWETWERINRLFGCAMLAGKWESLYRTRIDSTVTQTHIHAPSDSTLLADGMRLLNRLSERMQQEGLVMNWSNHSRAVKKRLNEIRSARGEDQRRNSYRKLLKVVQASVKQFRAMSQSYAGTWKDEAERVLDRLSQVIGQTQRRVLKGEQVPVADKIVSLFEAHTAIIVKDRRETQYGHKLNLTTGRAGFVLDVVVEEGNPADSTRLKPMVERIGKIYGRLPKQVAVDAGYASKEGVKAVRESGVKAVGLPRKRGMTVAEMGGSDWLYKTLKRFRAGIEGNISTLKRTFGLRRCLWHGLEGFKAYVLSSVFAYNLGHYARLVRQTV